MAEETTTAPDDWVTATVDRIVDTVDRVRTSGTDNVILAIRGVVFGLVALVFGVAALILTVVVMVRMADAYLPIGAGVGDATWAAHLLIGGLLSILGFGLWMSRRTQGSWKWAVTAGVVDIVILVVIVVYGIVDAVR